MFPRSRPQHTRRFLRASACALAAIFGGAACEAGFATPGANGPQPRPDAQARDGAREAAPPPDGGAGRADGAGPADVATPSDAAAARCAPTGGGPHWIEEGAPLAVKIRCASGVALAGTGFVLEGLPAGASYDPATATLHWTPRLDQAAVVVVGIVVPTVGERGEIKIGVADRFDDPANLPIADPMSYGEELGLPVMHLTVAPNINTDVYTPATVVYRGHRYSAEAQHRGASSLAYPKKNFTLRFAKDDKFSEPVFPMGEGFTDRRKVALVTTFDDNSQVRARLAFALWKHMDARNVAVTAYSAVVYLNGRYHGLYTVADKIDGNLMQRHGLREDGNLYMGIDHHANFAPFMYNEDSPQDESERKTNFATGFEKKEGLPLSGPGAFDDIAALSRFVAESSDATFAAEIGQRIELGDYVNWLVHATAIQAWDTMAKNAFHYRDAVGNGRFRVVLWDFNESFGQRYQTERFPQSIAPKDVLLQASGGFGYTNRDYLWRRLWNHPGFGPGLRARYAELVRGPLGKDVVLSAFEAMVAETAAGGRRDERRWSAAHRAFYRARRDFTTYEQEVAYVRRFITERWTFLAATPL